VNSSTVQNGSLGDYATVDGHSAGVYRSANSKGILIVASGPVTAWQSRTKFRDVVDGTSSTLMMGEKHIQQKDIGLEDAGGDGPTLGQYAYSIMRIAGEESGSGTGTLYPLGRGPTDDAGGQALTVFGGWHGGTTNFVFGDGHIQSLRSDIDPVTLARLATRSSGTIPGEY
jgi:prepilin-type processing-associated H-X9-DG protein